VAVALDVAGPGGNNTTGAALTVSHTIGTAGANTVVLAFVGIAVANNNTSTTGSATYGGTAMTQLGASLNGSGTSRSFTGIYYLFNPASGAQDCVFTPGGTATRAQVILSTISYKDVDSVGAFQQINQLSLESTSVADGYNIFGHTSGTTYSSPNQTQRFLGGVGVSGGCDSLLVQDAPGTGSSITFSVTGAFNTPSTFGVALSPAAVTAAPPLIVANTWTALQRANLY
jgi:hypothetical protein